MTSMNIYNTLFSVAGKNVLITGGSRGIGYMIAQGYAMAGANVILTSRDEASCQTAVSNILKEQQEQQPSANRINDNSNNTVQYITSNVATRDGCEELAKQVGQMFNGKLDILINNAGTSWGEPIERNSSKLSNWGFDKVFDLNVKGIYYLTRACIPYLRRDSANNNGGSLPQPKQNNDSNRDNETNKSRSGTHTPMEPGRIINIGSVTGIIPQEAPTYAYDCSKAAVHQLTRKFAKDLAAYNITVNCIAPGFVPTKMSAGLATWGGTTDTLAKHIPLQRMGNADDMIGACIYLSSHAGSWCTGVILNVDGGTVGAIQIPLSSL